MAILITILVFLLLIVHFGINIWIILEDLNGPDDLFCKFTGSELVIIFFIGWIILILGLQEEIKKTKSQQ